MRVTSLTDEPLQVQIDSATPWTPMLVDPGPFPIGTTQSALYIYKSIWEPRTIVIRPVVHP
jgi:hypothetical protein